LQIKTEHLDAVLERYADELARDEFLVVTSKSIRVADQPRS
jgi:hypothetical protein